MKINKVEINNFRAKTQLSIKIGSRLTLLVGENGSGKTSILDALSIGLGSILTYLPKVAGIAFKTSDIQQYEEGKAPYTRIRISADNGVEWDRTLRRDQSQRTLSQIPNALGLIQLKKFIDQEIINPFNENIKFILPVYSY